MSLLILEVSDNCTSLLLYLTYVCKLIFYLNWWWSIIKRFLLIKWNISSWFYPWQVAIGRRLGIEEPQLMKILRATLHTHNEWFKLQMCKDRFESLLRIDLLKEVCTPFLATVAMSKSHADSCTQGSSQITISSNARVSEDGSSPNQVSSADFVCDENAILKVMVSWLCALLFHCQVNFSCYIICSSFYHALWWNSDVKFVLLSSFGWILSWIMSFQFY